MAQVGTMCVPTVAYAPWQKGVVERKIEPLKSIVRKSVVHLSVKGEREMSCSDEISMNNQDVNKRKWDNLLRGDIDCVPLGQKSGKTYQTSCE